MIAVTVGVWGSNPTRLPILLFVSRLHPHRFPFVFLISSPSVQLPAFLDLNQNKIGDAGFGITLPCNIRWDKQYCKD